MPRKPNYNFEKRQKEAARQKRKAEKRERKRERREEQPEGMELTGNVLGGESGYGS